MDMLDKLYTEWAWRSRTGAPSMDNAEDKVLLENIIAELTQGGEFLSEVDANQYEEVIAHALLGDRKKTNEIPKPKSKYKLGNNGKVSSEDMEIWKTLYPVKPPKSGKEIGTAGSLGAGNGEIALYWLLSRSGYSVVDGRGDEQPDLVVNGIGLEVKAYGKRQITLGRFGKDYDTRKKLGYVLGLDVLISNLTGEQRAPSIDSFNKDELIRGFDTMSKFSSNKNLRAAAKEFALIGEIYSKIDALLEELELPREFKPRQGAAAILKQLLFTKAEKKPGFGGYMVDVSEDGRIEYKQVNKEKLDAHDADTIIKYVSANGSALKIYPDELFG